MASLDYLHCVSCGKRVLYDADLDYESSEEKWRLAELYAICKECNKTKQLVVIDRKTRKISELKYSGDGFGEILISEEAV